MSPRRLRVLAAPDSYKGSLSAYAVAHALRAGWLRGRPGDVVDVLPLGDGGEGTLDAIAACDGWERRLARVADPLGRGVEAAWLLSGDRRRAFVELAAASGLSLLLGAGRDERDALRATTLGTGELIRAALDAGAREIVLAIGGSATTDGGAGLLAALGARLLDGFGAPVPMGGGGLAHLASVQLDGLDPRLPEVTIRVACDVTNPLLGPLGAAATYGPQKGAGTIEIALLDAGLARFAALLAEATGADTAALATEPGTGAAGGTAFGLLALRGRIGSVELTPGAALVMEAVGFGERLASADLVLTGEGRIDAQTAFGKTCLAVAQQARARGIPCIAIGGSVLPEGEAVLIGAGAIVMATLDVPIDLDDAMDAGPPPVENAARRAACLVTLGEQSR